MPTIKVFRKNQRGLEGTPGTAVPATARWIGDMTLKETDKVYLPDYPYGVLAAIYHPGIQVAKAAELAYASDLTFEEIIDFLSASILGNVTPAEQNPSEGDYLWTFAHDVDDDPTPDTFTVELGNDDGTTPYGREVEYVFCKRLGITAGMDEPMKLSADLVGRQVTDAAITAALAVPTAWEPALSNKLKVYLDTTWAALGTTQLTGEVVDMSLDIVTGLREGKYLSGDLYFESYLFGPLAVDLTLTLEFDATADTEQEKVRDRSRRFVRLIVEGTQIGVGDNKAIQIDLSCIHAEDSIQEMFSDRDGNDTVRLHLLGAYDPTGAKDIEVLVTNGLSAIQ